MIWLDDGTAVELDDLLATGRSCSSSTSSTGPRPDGRSSSSCVTGSPSSPPRGCASSASHATRTGRTERGSRRSASTRRSSPTGTARWPSISASARTYRWMEGVPERSAFLVDADGTVRASWRYADSEVPDFDVLLEAARAFLALAAAALPRARACVVDVACGRATRTRASWPKGSRATARPRPATTCRPPTSSGCRAISWRTPRRRGSTRTASSRPSSRAPTSPGGRSGSPFWPLERLLGAVGGWNAFVLLSYAGAGLFAFLWLRVARPGAAAGLRGRAAVRARALPRRAALRRAPARARLDAAAARALGGRTPVAVARGGSRSRRFRCPARCTSRSGRSRSSSSTPRSD